MKCPRKRTLLMLLLLLMGGAIVNVAVAWGIAILFPTEVITSFSGMQDPKQSPRWVLGVYRHGGGVLVSSTAIFDRPEHQNSFPDDLPSWSSTYKGPPSFNDALHLRTVDEHAYGWPGVVLFNTKNGFHFSGGMTIHWFSQDRHLPFTPIWTGFAINTIFYAAILWLLF